MTRFGRALDAVGAAASLFVASTGTAPAAGALAVGPCGAYGFAYDYAAGCGAAVPRSASALAAARSCRCRRACGAIAIDGATSAVRTAMPSRRGSARRRIQR